MPAIASHNSIMAVKSENAGEVARSNGGSTPQKRRLRSDAAAVENMSPISTPMKLKSPRRCVNSSPNSGANVSNLALHNLRFTDKSTLVNRIVIDLIYFCAFFPFI